MKILFIKFAHDKKPALFLLLDDDGTRLLLLKHEAMDKTEIPLIRRMMPKLAGLPLADRMMWFTKLKSWKTAFRKFNKAGVNIISEFTPK